VSGLPTGQRLIARDSSGYPPLLSEIPGAPAALFISGRDLEPAPHVAVVGTRRASRYGLEVAAWIGGELASAGVVVVSGMAAGVDAAAHRGALRAAGSTVAVLGSGLDICYPRANAALYGEIATRGTLVSEYPPGTRPTPGRFPARNRIIAGLSLGVVIVEARRDGGAMITARLAMEYGREVFAVAGPVHAPGSEGPHALVRDGARLVTCARDVLEDLGLGEARPLQESLVSESLAPTAGLSPDARCVLAVLQAEPLVLDRIAQLARMPASAAASILCRLELAGLASRHPGARFARPVAGAKPFSVP
jgi:DNA processing protein